MTSTRAVVLAAGRGQRLGLGIPKCLLVLGGQTLLERQLRALASASITDVTLVVGFKREEVRVEAQRISSHLPIPLNITFIRNVNYRKSNTADSLLLALDSPQDSGVVLLNGDVLFEPTLIPKLFGRGSCLAVATGPCGDEEVKACVDGRRVIALGKGIAPNKALGEFIGVAFFDRRLVPELRHSLRTLASRPRGNAAYFEDALTGLLREHEVSWLEVEKGTSIEIDFQVDLKRAREQVLPRLQATPVSSQRDSVGA